MSFSISLDKERESLSETGFDGFFSTVFDLTRLSLFFDFLAYLLAALLSSDDDSVPLEYTPP